MNKWEHLCLKAEEQLKLVEDQRKILEERQRLEDGERRRVREEQEVILNKKNARPRLSFSLGKWSELRLTFVKWNGLRNWMQCWSYVLRRKPSDVVNMDVHG